MEFTTLAHDTQPWDYMDLELYTYTACKNESAPIVHDDVLQVDYDKETTNSTTRI